MLLRAFVCFRLRPCASGCRCGAAPPMHAPPMDGCAANTSAENAVRFGSVRFGSVRCSSVLLTVLFCSVLLCSVLFCSVLFCSALFFLFCAAEMDASRRRPRILIGAPSAARAVQRAGFGASPRLFERCGAHRVIPRILRYIYALFAPTPTISRDLSGLSRRLSGLSCSHLGGSVLTPHSVISFLSLNCHDT